MEMVRLADSVANQLEARILEGSLRPGQTLPPERVLAQDLGVSRPTLREALQKLSSKGLVRKRQGGGTIITDRLQSSFVEPWRDMLANHPGLQQDLLEFRFMLEGEATALATERATDMDLKRIESTYRALDQAFAHGTLDECVHWDVQFHQGIAEASHNVFIAHLTASLVRLMQDHIARNLHSIHAYPQRWDKLRAQHADIWAHLQSRSTDPAAAAAREHISYLHHALQYVHLEANRLQSSRRRSEWIPPLG